MWKRRLRKVDCEGSEGWEVELVGGGGDVVDAGGGVACDVDVSGFMSAGDLGSSYTARRSSPSWPRPRSSSSSPVLSRS